MNKYDKAQAMWNEALNTAVDEIQRIDAEDRSSGRNKEVFFGNLKNVYDDSKAAYELYMDVNRTLLKMVSEKTCNTGMCHGAITIRSATNAFAPFSRIFCFNTPRSSFLEHNIRRYYENFFPMYPTTTLIRAIPKLWETSAKIRGYSDQQIINPTYGDQCDDPVMRLNDAYLWALNGRIILLKPGVVTEICMYNETPDEDSTFSLSISFSIGEKTEDIGKEPVNVDDYM